MSTKTKHTPRPAIELHTPVDGNFLLVNKPSGELFAKNMDTTRCPPDRRRAGTVRGWHRIIIVLG